MAEDRIQEIVENVGVGLTHPLFFSRTFFRLRPSMDEADELQSLVLEQFDELSRRLDHTEIQDSAAVRNLIRVRKVCEMLIGENGDINLMAAQRFLDAFAPHCFSLGPDRYPDAIRNEHLRSAVEKLINDSDVQRVIKQISRPIQNKNAESLVRATLGLDRKARIGDAEARRAALCAWLTFLRQSVGSCFATAPAILIQQNIPLRFFQDVNDLLSTGRLSRTFSGKEHAVPLSSSWGVGDFKRPFILYTHLDRNREKYWYSPGLIAALEAVGIIQEGSLRQKITRCKEVIGKVAEAYGDVYSISTSSEELVRQALLQHHGLSEQDLLDYELRPRAMIHSSLLMQVAHEKTGSGKGGLCKAFHEDMESAQTAFKALTENPLLRAWEYTLASFSESKASFTRWNLYSSLGLKENDEGGIGRCLYEVVQQKLDHWNGKHREAAEQSEVIYTVVKTLETRMRTSRSEQEIQWIRTDYQSKVAELRHYEAIARDASARASKIAGLYQFLADEYIKRFEVYFQEVYDADLHEVTTGLYDDSPAGFRLLYKHGRTNPSLWSQVKSHTEFSDVLANFFVAVESDLAVAPEVAGLEEDIAHITTGLVSHVRSRVFIETAFERMALAHGVTPVAEPLKNLDKVEKKPWVYTSGGTMDNLVSCYFNRGDKPTQVERWVDSETTLLVFLIETVRKLGQDELRNFQADSSRGLLMHSPTHAFVLKPGYEVFQAAWKGSDYPPNWVDEVVINPGQAFAESMVLSEQVVRDLLLRLIPKVPDPFRPRFTKVFNAIPGGITPIELRGLLSKGLFGDPGLQEQGSPIVHPDDIDALIYSSLPYTTEEQLGENLSQIWKVMPSLSTSEEMELNAIFKRLPLEGKGGAVISSKRMQQVCKSMLGLLYHRQTVPFDVHKEVALALRQLELAGPAPVIFADSNWARDYFGFLVNPGTGNLELWRLDYTGLIGSPMSHWKKWLDGSRTDRTWGVYINPHEYML